MNALEFRNNILTKRPRYAKSRIPVIEALANKGNKKSEYNQFGPIYELYVFAFTLGLKKNLNLPLPPRNATADFLEIGKWKRDSKLVDFLLMIVFAYSDKVGFSWNDLEDMEENELNNVISKIIEFIESFANGGLYYLQKEWEQNNLIKSHYVFVDLMAENSVLPDINEDGESRITVEESNEDIIESTLNLIEQGESTKTEFKSTLRVNMFTDKPDVKMEHSCMKTIAGFINTNGGTLIIGIDDKKEILGLEKDYNSFGNKPNPLDEFQKHIDNLIEKTLGNSAFSLIMLSFPDIEGETVCRVDVNHRKNGPIYCKNKQNGNKEEFFIRRAASTKSLNPSEMADYIENHWG